MLTSSIDKWKTYYEHKIVIDLASMFDESIYDGGFYNELSHFEIKKRQTQNRKVYDTYYSVYNADAGQAFYEKQRLNCGRRPKWANTDAFIDWADD